MRIAAAALSLLTATLLVGCGGRSTLDVDERPTSRPVGTLGTGFFEPRVEAFVIPPKTWRLDPPKINDERSHLTWLSPTGDTAYGVVYFNVPGITTILPTEFLHRRAADRYIEEFDKEVGDATLESQAWDESIDAMRLVAEGGPYRVRSMLRIRGNRGWSVYAGTLRENAVNEAELDLAVSAREATQVGLDAEGGGEAAEAALDDVADSGDRSQIREENPVD
ncbi:MAG: hypothetical protein AAF561_08480 [Planctomycetota bacterium]